VDVGDIEDIDKVLGFCRPHDKDLHNTVQEYYKHFFVCSGEADWPASFVDTNIGALLHSMKTTGKHFPVKIKVSVCDLKTKTSSDPATERTGFDILVFPDMIRFRDVTPQTVSNLFAYLTANNNDKNNGVNDHSHDEALNNLDHNTNSSNNNNNDTYSTDNNSTDNSSCDGYNNDNNIDDLQAAIEPLTSKFLFVCTDKTKDLRCGYCGPILVDEFNKQLAEGDEDVCVSGVTHVGGHSFAGNVLVFPPGDWLGYVSPSVVPKIIKHYTNEYQEGQIIEELFRGKMAVVPPVSAPTPSPPTA